MFLRRTVAGLNKKILCKECNQKKVRAQEEQPPQTYWITYTGEEQQESFSLEQLVYVGEICPTGLALRHHASNTLVSWTTHRYPVETGQN